VATVGNHRDIVYPGIPNIDVENPSCVDHCPRSSPGFFHIHVRLRRVNKIAELPKWGCLWHLWDSIYILYIYMIWIDMEIIILAMGTRNYPMNTRLYVHSNSYVHSSWRRESHFPSENVCSEVANLAMVWGPGDPTRCHVPCFGWGNGMVSSR
jgi:hypothetical protein